MKQLYKRFRVADFVAFAITFSAQIIGQPKAAGPDNSAFTTPPGEEVVQRMEQRNQQRLQALRHYVSERHYHVEYHGFPVKIAASMDVEATYDAPSTKTFRVLSQTGSGLLIDRVLKKLLKSEQEAAQDPSKTALTTANYNFSLIGVEAREGRPLYVLHVEPKGPGKLLYRGRIWVDGNDYAVEKIEAEPAQNPSFWIKKTEIHHLYSKTGDFWLPKENRSETKVSIGGTAILTIDYGTYRVEPANPR